jgi:hypothetical protein
MTTILIILVLIVLYFFISLTKENEARETVEKSRKENNRKLANLHFGHIVEQELTRQKNLEESRKVFIQQLESQEDIYKVSIEDDTLTIVTQDEIGMFEATEYANMWINLLIPSTEIDVVKIYNRDGLICGSAKRNVEVDINEIQSQKTPTPSSNINIKLNESYKTRHQFSSMFYNYCFSKENAKTFLVDNSLTEEFIKILKISRFQLEKVNLLEMTFKIYVRKAYGIELGESSYGFYTIDNEKFFIDTQRIAVGESAEPYFEILYNDLEDIKDEDGDSIAIAKEFILYVKHFIPKAIFVLVYDPILEIHVLRRVTEDGVSFKLTVINDNESPESIEFLKKYILDNNI